MIPPNENAYGELDSPDQCRVLLSHTQTTWVELDVRSQDGKDTTALYKSAAYACLAQWDDAIQAFNEITQRDFGNNFQCARMAAYGWLSALIQERKNDPNFSPVFVSSSSSVSCAKDETTSTSSTTSTEPTSSTTSTEPTSSTTSTTR